MKYHKFVFFCTLSDSLFTASQSSSFLTEFGRFRCPIVFQGQLSNFKVTQDKKIGDFDANWAFPDCNSSLNSPKASKWYTKLDVVWKRCPIVFARSSIKFQGHTGHRITDYDANWAILGCNSNLNSHMALKWCTRRDSKEEVPHCFSSSSIKFQDHTRQNNTDFDPNRGFPDCNYNLILVLKLCTKLDVV